MLPIVTTPTKQWLDESVKLCSSRLLVSSPYVGPLLPQIIADLRRGVTRVLLTKTDLRDFATGASDIDSLCKVARTGTDVLSLARLHAKVYVVDDKRALVTSANATFSGMQRNWECGVAFDDPAQVRVIADLLLSGFGADPPPQRWKPEELERLRDPVRTLREQLPPAKHLSGLLPELASAPSPPLQLASTAASGLFGNFPGWLQLALDGVLAQPDDEFTMEDLFQSCRPMIAARFPGNRYPRQKLRQQIQRLRDLGIVDFLGGGRYVRTIRASGT